MRSGKARRRAQDLSASRSPSAGGPGPSFTPIPAAQRDMRGEEQEKWPRNDSTWTFQCERGEGESRSE
ncbi:Hypp7846 [Branchiostoma lanceolatum]|uniref:Hypp7846 protein n=1 Tax=Branchiostoma lanceolatum TaxID=7740 RepID=A0A8K0EFP8_BRALA|nr:Hypp7846 [Branchiostoma lanceolatum]